MQMAFYIEKGWGSYKELIELSIRDFVEIRVSVESRMQEEEMAKSLSS